MPLDSIDFSLTGTQAGGAVSHSVAPVAGQRLWRHCAQAEITLTADGTQSAATSGTLSIRGRVPGAAAFQELGVISLTSPAPVIYEGYYEEIRGVSAAFDTDKTWTLYITSGDR